MSETAAQIFAESVKLVSNPPQSTTRSPAAIEADIVKQKDVVARFDAACKAEGLTHGQVAAQFGQHNTGGPTVNGDPHYVLSSLYYELHAAIQKGNK